MSGLIIRSRPDDVEYFDEYVYMFFIWFYTLFPLLLFFSLHVHMVGFACSTTNTRFLYFVL
jgi:hypothetical protein